MSLLVVGSVAFDSIHTPTHVRERVLGGSAVYFSYAASYFTPVRLVGGRRRRLAVRAYLDAQEPQY